MGKSELISIPKRYRTALVRLVELPPSQLSTFVSSLTKAKPESSIYALARQLSPANPEMDDDDIRDILNMLASLYRFHINLGGSVKELVNGFVSTAKREAERGVISTVILWPKFRETLRSIFDAEGTLSITAKASELVHEHERVFCPASTRMLTDVRPVFLAAPSENPHAAIIQHTLKLAYHGNEGEASEFYVSLSGDDIDMLIYLLLRSQDKEKSLRKLLKSTGIKLMASDEGLE